MIYKRYSFMGKKKKLIDTFGEIDCHKCTHCFDNGTAIHIYSCSELGDCVDCYPNQCKGTRFKPKSVQT